MNISMGYGEIPSDEYSGELLNQSLDNGYTFLDTAAMYGMGHSESLIGKYLGHRRNEFVLASKCGIFRNDDNETEVNGRPEVLQRTCEDSLGRLQTDVIDLYYLHRIDPDVPVEESVGALSRMVEQGKIQTIGLSEISTDSLRRAHATHPITAVQSEYSLWSRTPERGVLEVCSELEIAFVPFSPLGRQFLTGKCPALDKLDDDDIRATIALPRFEPGTFEINQQLLTPFSEIAEQQNCTMAQLALAWLLALGENMIPIPGTKHLEFMTENALAGDIVLSAETVEALDQLINENTVSGRRYTDEGINTTDSERDQ